MAQPTPQWLDDVVDKNDPTDSKNGRNRADFAIRGDIVIKLAH
jgi:hypothetical protein